MAKTLMILFTLLALGIFMSGCISPPSTNTSDEESSASGDPSLITEGMTKAEVRQVAGQPYETLNVNGEHWIYESGDDVYQVSFVGDKVLKIKSY